MATAAAPMVREGLMADQTPSPSGGDRPATESVRLASDLVEMARVICFSRRVPKGRRLKIAEYLESLLREPITRDYQQETSGEQGKGKKGGGKP